MSVVLRHIVVVVLLFPATVLSSEIKQVADLEALFAQQNYQWPARGGLLPAVFLKALPGDFAKIREPKKRKRLFVQLMAPIALLEKQRLEEQRSLALLLAKRQSLDSPRWSPWLNQIAARYKAEHLIGNGKLQEKLNLQLDALPLKLILAQAAMESGWGSSRFAHEGNSLFGQWSFNGQGIIPNGREGNKTHRVSAYPDLQASVRAYLHNINTNRAYKKLRNMRAQMRQNHQPLDPFKLAEGLDRYSQRGQAYVHELQAIMRLPEFEALTSVRLPLPRVESTSGYASSSDR